MRGFVRENTVAVTGGLTIVSLALVFGAVLQVGGTSLPRIPVLIDVIPHVNATLSLLAIGTILAGIRAIRLGNVDRHRMLMLASFGLFVTFLVLYLYRVSLEGPTPFEGPQIFETYLYYPVLAIHVSLAIVCVPLLFYVLSLAYAHPVTELPVTNHGRIGRLAATLWLISFALGVAVYLLLYGPLPT